MSDKKSDKMPRHLVLTIIIFAAAAITALTGALYDLYRPAPGESVTVAAPQTVPDFGVTTMDGQTVHITDLRGKVVIVNFWATWCAPCVVEFPTLINIVAHYKGDVVLLALSSDRDRAAVENFIKDQQAKSTSFDAQHIIVAIDENRNLTRDMFHVGAYPESLIIAPNGTIARHIIGIDAWADPETTEQIDKMLVPAGNH